MLLIRVSGGVSDRGVAVGTGVAVLVAAGVGFEVLVAVGVGVGVFDGAGVWDGCHSEKYNST